MQPDPVLSVVVAVVSDTVRSANTDHLRPCLDALVRQVDPPPFEIIVPHHPNLAGIGTLRGEFPQVRFLEIHDLARYTGRPGNREHHNELRARGIAAAAGKMVALIEDHGVADPHWCARMVAAHAEKTVAAIGGPIENGVPRLLNWAVYFCDFGRYQNPAAAVDTFAISDANVSYQRSALESIRPVWREVFHEGAVNHVLEMRGERMVLEPDLPVYQQRRLDLRTALEERWVWGKSFGAGRGLSGLSRLVWAALAPALPGLILARLAAGAARKRGQFGPFCRALPMTALLVTTWCLGEMAAYLLGTRIEHGRQPDRAADEGPSLPAGVSVVVVRTGEGKANLSSLAATLDALERQTIPALEVIVPCASMEGVAALRARYPATLFPAAGPVSPARSGERLDELRAIGVAAARGGIIAVTEDHVRPDPDWIVHILQAHREGYAAIGGAIENGIDRPLNWATYFTDLGRYHNPVPAGESGYASVVNVSYKRRALENIRAVWKQRFSETAVHAALMAYGERLGLSAEIVVRQYREDVKFTLSMREFFTWGRSYGSTRARLAGTARRLVYACLSPLIPAVLLLRGGVEVLKRRRLVAAWLKSLPVAAALTIAWSGGELMGYLAGEASAPMTERVRQSHAGQ